MRKLSIAIAPAIAVCWVGCSTGAGDGSVWGSVYLPDCDVVDMGYDMNVDFFAADYFDNTLQIRLQHTGADQVYSDGLVILVRDVGDTSSHLGQTRSIEVEPDLDNFLAEGPDAGYPETTPGSPARATLYLNALCPGNRYAFTDGAGRITFRSIYVPDEQKRIAGEFELRFVDPREWESPEDIGPHAELFGEFDFNFTRGSPAQTFPK